ncbi:Lipoyltransferase and lipoate-protein ligase [Coprinopsis marcescibilis]|uniref:Putative lipoate-protein ligase A n=1 Tax=Coprinopsis marcescibilis TaxID=230819 RepID=A0A5C3L897_COPMA|nr:Lipoyltransferase and lipoate-protein ligase [Coprinopsis marcescibilis]
MAHTVLHSSRHVPAGWLNWIRHSCSWSGHPRLKFRTLASVVQPRVTPVSRPREGCSTPVNGSLQLRHASSQTSASDFGGVSILNDWAKHSIFVSTSTDPFFNLSLEDMLFRRHDKTKPLLLIYRDTPCVVIGRNQTPYKEINLAELNRLKIPFIRRKSGGGTVFHDLGNTNYSIHLARTTFDRHVTAQVIVRALQRLGLDAGVNDRNDICIGTNKVSGSAYKIVNNRAYHHGTMLISTRLDTLGNVLRVNKDNLITKGVASVRSPVCNLQQHNPGIGHEEFTNAVIDEFRDEYSVRTEVCFVSDSKEILDEPDIRNGMVELQSWEVLYGQTPEFTHKLERQFPWGHVVGPV